MLAMIFLVRPYIHSYGPNQAQHSRCKLVTAWLQSPAGIRPLLPLSVSVLCVVFLTDEYSYIFMLMHIICSISLNRTVCEHMYVSREWRPRVVGSVHTWLWKRRMPRVYLYFWVTNCRLVTFRMTNAPLFYIRLTWLLQEVAFVVED